MIIQVRMVPIGELGFSHPTTLPTLVFRSQRVCNLEVELQSNALKKIATSLLDIQAARGYFKSRQEDMTLLYRSVGDAAPKRHEMQNIKWVCRSI